MTTTVNGTNGVMTNGQPSSWQAKHQVPSHFIGGNHLDVAPPSAVKDFVQNSDGHSVITSVSIAKFAPAAYQRLTNAFFRFLLPITVSPQSKRSEMSENGPTKPSATRRPYSSQ